MKKLGIILLLFVAIIVVAEDYNPTTSAPQLNETQLTALMKINRILADAQNGDVPLVTNQTGAVLSIRRGTLVSKSGTANGSSQSVSAANTSRSYFSFQNPSGNTGTFWVDPLGGTAATGSPRIEIKPGQGFVWSAEAVPTNAITVIGTSGEKWTAYEF